MAGRKELENAIRALLSSSSVNEVLSVVLPEMHEEQLQTVIQVILDPTFKEKQDVLTSPKRFVTNGEVV